MKNDKEPLVSIGMPVYNGEKLISQAIESLLAQDFEDFELIISDNNSSDRTGELCKAYAGKDGRIVYLRNSKNVGMVANFNKVAYQAQGQYFMWASHDDLWEPSFISCLIRPLMESPAVVIAYPNVLTVAVDGKYCWEEKDDMETVGMRSPRERVRKVYKGIVRCTPIHGLMRRDAVMKAFPVPSVRGPDDAFLALMALRGEFVYIPERLFTYRMQEHCSIKLNRKNLHIHYQMEYEPDAARPKKFNTYWTTTIAIVQRVLHEELAFSTKVHICVDTFFSYGIRKEWERLGLRGITDPRRWKRKIVKVLTSSVHEQRVDNESDS